jgi:V8-like Glu-specific endopeptidase
MSRRNFAFVPGLFALAALACNSADAPAPAPGGSEPAASVKQPPPEIVSSRGKRLVRRDLWSSADLERLRYAAGTGEPDTVEELAEALRGHVMAHGAYYIETEPDLEMAERIMNSRGDEVGTDGGRPREQRLINNNDDRTHDPGSWDDYPTRTFGFSDVGCSATMIGRRTAITAAHCLFETIFQPNGWICADGIEDSDGAICTDPGEPGHQSWRWGVKDFNVFEGGPSCWQLGVPNQFVNLAFVGNGNGFARWDFGFINFAGCGNPGANTGWLGTLAASNATIQSSTVFLYGYPMFAPCPPFTQGGPGDCAGNFQYTSPNAPFFGAEIWGMTGAAGTAVPTDTGVITWTGDWTHGQSGSSLWLDGGNSFWKVIGVASISPPNRLSRFTSETHNFLVALTDYPDDGV